MYIESSAKEDENVKETFFKLMEDMHWKSINNTDNINKNNSLGNLNQFGSNSNKNNNGCCN